MADIGDTKPNFAKRRVQLQIEHLKLEKQGVALKIQDLEIQRDEKQESINKLESELELYDK